MIVSPMAGFARSSVRVLVGGFGIVAAIMDADAGGVGAIVCTGIAAIDFAIADDPFAGLNPALAAKTGTFGLLGHDKPHVELSAVGGLCQRRNSIRRKTNLNLVTYKSGAKIE
jgi:hypothetical protein